MEPASILLRKSERLVLIMVSAVEVAVSTFFRNNRSAINGSP